MARETLTMVGMIVGSSFGPVGAAIGSMIGNAVGSAIDPLTFQGPSLSDAIVQTSRDGIPIPIGFGVTHLLGNIIQINPMVIVKQKEGNKKSGITESDRQTRTFAIGIGRGMDGPIGGIRRVWENNKLIYDVRTGSTFPSEDNLAFEESTSIYLGDEHQLPDSELETHTGVDTPAYRGLAYIVFINKDVTSFGGSIPSYRFEISSCPRFELLDDVLAWWNFEEASGGTGTLLYNEVTDATLRSTNAYTSTSGVDGQAATLAVTGLINIDSQNSPVGSIDPITLVDQPWACTGWWKTPASLSGLAGDYIVCQWVHSVPAVGERKWRLIYNATETGFVYSIGHDGNPAVFTDLDTGDIGLKASTWYHFALTHDPDTNQMSITASERGAATGTRMTEAVSGGAYDSGAHSDFLLSVGRDRAGVVTTDGTMDMLAFWNKALTADEVTALHSQEITYNGLSSESSPDTTGSVSWESIFGVPFSLGYFFGNFTFLVPEEGVSIRFTIPAGATAYKVKFTSLETASNPTIRHGAVNQTVLNFSSGVTFDDVSGYTIDCGVNDTNQDIELIPGNTYFFNYRTQDYAGDGVNWATLQASSLEIT